MPDFSKELHFFTFPLATYEGPVSSHSHQDLQLSFCYSHFLTMKSYLTGVLICISLVTNATEHHFKCLLAMNLLWRNDYSDAVSIF